MEKVVYMALQKETMMKTIKFNAPCHIGDTIYYVWARKKNNKYTFKMKKSVVLGFLIKNFGQYICVKDKHGTDNMIDVPMNCVSTNKYIIKAAYKKEQDTVTGILVTNENEIASVLGKDGGVYSFLELERD